jgi:hypothetical protein
MSDLSNLRPMPGSDRSMLDRVRDAIGGARKGPTVSETMTTARQRIAAWFEDGAKGPARRRGAVIVAAVLLVGGGAGSYFALRATPMPDYDTAGLDDVFNYTLLTDDFNNLPIEERLKLMRQLVARLKSMSANDSMLLGAFAAGIAGAARDQLEENGSKLAIDAWDKYAQDYAKIPDENRAEFLDDTFIEMSKMLEIVANGTPRDVSDEKRLEEMQDQVQRDGKRLRENPDAMPNNEQLGELFAFMNFTVGGHANTQQRQRGQQMMRDMTRHFRGKDTATGKPK